MGKTEEALTAERVPYEIGISRWRELARGQIVGDANGLLKLLVSRPTTGASSASTRSAPAPPS